MAWIQANTADLRVDWLLTCWIFIKQVLNDCWKIKKVRLKMLTQIMLKLIYNVALFLTMLTDLIPRLHSHRTLSSLCRPSGYMASSWSGKPGLRFIISLYFRWRTIGLNASRDWIFSCYNGTIRVTFPSFQNCACWPNYLCTKHTVSRSIWN